MVERSFRSWKGRTNSVSVLWCLAAAIAGGVGCSNTEDAPVTNTIRFELDLGGGVNITAVDYVMTGPNDFRRTGSVGVGNSSIVTATFQNLPKGQGYNIQVRGNASDGETSCRGEATFNVNGSMTATVQIPLTCQGLISITGTINLCPVIDSLSAIPAEVAVGSAIQLAVEFHDGNPSTTPPTAIWTTTGGTLTNKSTSGATFTCAAPGTFTVGVQISDGDTTGLCPGPLEVTLVCTPATSAALLVTSSPREGSV